VLDYIDYYVASALGKRPVPPYSFYSRYDGFRYIDDIYVGGSVGSFWGTDRVTNLWQITFFGLDPRPNPLASLSANGVTGNVFVGFNRPVVNLNAGVPLIIGGEYFHGFGSHTTMIAGIPGMTGIASPSVVANDSTTVKFGDNSGVIARIGTVLPFGRAPLFVAFDGGVGWQDIYLMFRCTQSGACGANGISDQNLSVHQTRTGTLLGGELGFQLPWQFPQIPFLSQPSARFQYLHGDYGSVTVPLGAPSQLEIGANQQIKTDCWSAGINFGLNLRY
jgi:hypothetical protein